MQLLIMAELLATSSNILEVIFSSDSYVQSNPFEGQVKEVENLLRAVKRFQSTIEDEYPNIANLYPRCQFNNNSLNAAASQIVKHH